MDIELGLTRDGFSMLLRSYASRLATKVSYAQATLILSWFLCWSPAQESLEEMVLGLGQHTAAWFEQAPAPEGDGKVLVIQMDCKATPTATEGNWRNGAARVPRIPIQGRHATEAGRPGSGGVLRNGGTRATKPRTAKWRRL